MGCYVAFEYYALFVVVLMGSVWFCLLVGYWFGFSWLLALLWVLIVIAFLGLCVWYYIMPACSWWFLGRLDSAGVVCGLTCGSGGVWVALLVRLLRVVII